MGLFTRKNKEDETINCGQRAFRAGLRWCGIEDEVPSLPQTGDSIKLADKYKALVAWWPGLGSFEGDYKPVLVTYANGEVNHCVFSSDILPLRDKNIHLIITGWEELRKQQQLSVP